MTITSPIMKHETMIRELKARVEALEKEIDQLKAEHANPKRNGKRQGGS